MDQYFGGLAAAILLAILGILLKGRNQEASIALTMVGCCGICLLAVRFLEPVIAFLRELGSMAASGGQTLGILLKILGIGFAGEVAALVCADSGNSALAKTVQMLTAGVILYLSLPVLTALLALVEEILKAV
jgi:stage III sporulation protein AD